MIMLCAFMIFESNLESPVRGSFLSLPMCYVGLTCFLKDHIMKRQSKNGPKDSMERKYKTRKFYNTWWKNKWINLLCWHWLCQDIHTWIKYYQFYRERDDKRKLRSKDVLYDRIPCNFFGGSFNNNNNNMMYRTF